MKPDTPGNPASEPDPSARPKLTPAREAWHRTIFSIVCYGCLLVLFVTGIPRVRAMFTPRGSSVSESLLVEELSRALDLVVTVEHDPRSDRYSYKLGSQWHLLLAPLLLFVGLTLALRDKTLAGRLQYWLVHAMGLALILGCVMLLVEVFRHTAGKLG